MPESSDKPATIQVVATATGTVKAAAPPLADWLVFVPVLLAHLLIDIALQVPLIRRALPQAPEAQLCLMGIAQGQATVLAVWLARGRWASYVRYVIGLPLLLGIATSLTSLMPFPLRHAFAPVVFLGLAVQCALITIGILVFAWARTRQRLSFDMASVLGWTAVAGVALILFPVTQVDWRNVGAMLPPMFAAAVTNAALGLACLATIAARRPLWIAVAIVCGIGLALLQGFFVGFPMSISAPMITIQVIVVTISLLLIRRQIGLLATTGQ